MRNLLITLEYPPARGGVARYLETIVSAFPDQFRVWTSSEGSEAFMGTQVRTLLSKQVWPHWLPALRDAVASRKDYDKLWFSHVLPLGYVGLVMRWFWRKPYVIMLHGLDFRLACRSAWKRTLLRMVLNHAELVVGNTKTLCGEVRAFCPELQPLVIYPTLPSSMRTLSPVLHTDRPLNLLTVSRLVGRKNHQTVIRAIEGMKDVHYHIVGSGPLEKPLRTLVHELGLNERVTFSPGVSDKELQEAYQGADLFVLSVLMDQVDIEGFGIVYLEAGYAGLPIIATDLPGVREALHEEGSVMLSEPTVEHVREAIEALRNVERRSSMGEVSRYFVDAHFHAEKQMEKLKPYV